MHTRPTLATATMAALDIVQPPVWVFDPHTIRFVHGNPAALRLWGAASVQDFMQRDLGHASLAVRTRTNAALAQPSGGAVLHERITIYPHGLPPRRGRYGGHPDERRAPARRHCGHGHRVNIQRVADPATGQSAALVNEQDVTVAVDARLRVEHLTIHDPLTDLPNRILFRRRLDAAQSGAPFAALMLDRFKAVNDTHGHGTGDEVLQTVAARLRGAIRHTDTLDGDEFGVLLPGVGMEAATAIAAAMVDRLRGECSAAGHLVCIGASVGIALQATNPHGGLDALLRDADRALYDAKAAGRNTYRIMA